MKPELQLSTHKQTLTKIASNLDLALSLASDLEGNQRELFMTKVLVISLKNAKHYCLLAINYCLEE